MSKDILHPTVEEFRQFMNARPALVLELRKSGNSLQDYYNKWVEHGEDDLIWGMNTNEHKETKVNDADLLGQMLKYTENIDINKLQGRVTQFNKILDTVQLLLNDFMGNQHTKTDLVKQPQLFNLFRD